jgi:diketogulonate reductase-like aldo/keto reductase
MAFNFVTTNSGVQMPKMIYGTAWKESRTVDCVTRALRAGFRGVDTACQPKHYQEDMVGEAITGLIQSGEIQRSDLFLQTKYTAVAGQDPARMPYDASLPLAEQARASMEVSLANLNTDYVDSWVVHSIQPTQELMMEVWQVFEEMKDQGKCRQIGVSNCYEIHRLRDLWDAARIKPSIVQNRYVGCGANQTKHVSSIILLIGSTPTLAMTRRFVRFVTSTVSSTR